jgi:hypothetical protein
MPRACGGSADGRRKPRRETQAGPPWSNPKIIEGETHTEALRALNRPDQRMGIHAQLLAGVRCHALARCMCHTEGRN